MQRDKESGKFIVSDDSLYKIFALRVDTELHQWIKEQGGSSFVRSLILAEKARREAATVKESGMG
ncbi:hypothetical protein H6G91_17140 [Nostoc muscorum FACHB-395]|nr:hypothetical protein [Desmonostoc muscorum FACHB-395]